MRRIVLRPTVFDVPAGDRENPYVAASTDAGVAVNKRRAREQHVRLTHAIDATVVPSPRDPSVPDITFISSAGLSLPRLPEPVVILPHMKFARRRAELPYVKAMLTKLGVRTIPFPGSADAPFEGQPEVKWLLGGRLAFMSYGYRSTAESARRLEALLNDVYEEYGIEPPTFIAAHVQSPRFYHLDLAAFVVKSGRRILFHEGAFHANDLRRLRAVMGREAVATVKTHDMFLLNAVECDDVVITHRTTDPKAAMTLAAFVRKPLHEVDVGEFEKSGGGVRCLVFDLFVPRRTSKERYT